MFSKKYHFFYISYADKNAKPVGMTFYTRKPFVNNKDLLAGRIQCELEPVAPVLAISYMGRMSLKQWNSQK